MKWPGVETQFFQADALYNTPWRWWTFNDILEDNQFVLKNMKPCIFQVILML